MNRAHKARHAAPLDPKRQRAAATASADYEPHHGAGVKARDELAVTTYTGHGLGHTYRADIRFGGVL